MAEKEVETRGPVESGGLRRELGTGEGDFVVPDGFDAPLPEEVLAEFER